MWHDGRLSPVSSGHLGVQGWQSPLSSHSQSMNKQSHNILKIHTHTLKHIICFVVSLFTYAQLIISCIYFDCRRHIFSCYSCEMFLLNVNQHLYFHSEKNILELFYVQAIDCLEEVDSTIGLWIMVLKHFCCRHLVFFAIVTLKGGAMYNQTLSKTFISSGGTCQSQG